MEARIKIGWNKFRQLMPLLTNKAISLIVKERLGLYDIILHMHARTMDCTVEDDGLVVLVSILSLM